MQKCNTFEHNKKMTKNGYSLDPFIYLFIYFFDNVYWFGWFHPTNC